MYVYLFLVMSGVLFFFAVYPGGKDTCIVHVRV